MDPVLVLVVIFAVFVPVGIILSLVVFPALRKRRTGPGASGGVPRLPGASGPSGPSGPSAADDLRDEPPLDDHR